MYIYTDIVRKFSGIQDFIKVVSSEGGCPCICSLLKHAAFAYTHACDFFSRFMNFRGFPNGSRGPDPQAHPLDPSLMYNSLTHIVLILDDAHINVYPLMWKPLSTMKGFALGHGVFPETLY